MSRRTNRDPQMTLADEIRHERALFLLERLDDRSPLRSASGHMIEPRFLSEICRHDAPPRRRRR